MKNNILKLSAFLAFFIGFVSCSDDDDNNEIITEELSVFETIEDNPNAVLLYQTTAQITGFDTFGATLTDPIPAEGRRTNFNFSGPVSGQISGNLVGTDYATVYPNGDIDLDIFGTITTTDGAKIAVNYNGRTTPSSATLSDLTEIGKLNSNDPNYAYLNDMHIVGVGTSNNTDNTLSISIYGFEEDPFNGEDPYTQIDEVDYANFPYTYDNIENDPNGTLVYEATVSTIGTEGFGVNVTDFFSGVQPIPAEGARADFVFAGTSQGEVTGNISGVDFVVIHPDGSLTLNVRGQIETADGTKVSLKVNGTSFTTDQPGISHLFETVELKSNHPDYNYLNDKHVIGVGISNGITNILTLRLYRFDENPLN